MTDNLTCKVALTLFIISCSGTESRPRELLMEIVRPAPGLVFIDRYPATAEEYEACARARGCSPPLIKARHPSYIYEDVTWQDAQSYCRWRGLRLPTVAEWPPATGRTLSDPTGPTLSWLTTPVRVESMSTAFSIAYGDHLNLVRCVREPRAFFPQP